MLVRLGNKSRLRGAAIVAPRAALRAIVATTLVAALTTALVLIVAAPTVRAADPSPGPNPGAATPPESAPLKELPDLVLAPWLTSQGPRGNYIRPSGVPANDGYANAGIAYAMLLEAARSGNDAYFKSAMRAISWINRTRYPMQGVFYRMFSAAAYNVARASFGKRIEFRRVRRAWANQLRRFPYQRGLLGTYYRYNKNLVEALSVIELYRTGLRTNTRKLVLSDRREALRRAVRLMNVQIPRNARKYSARVGAQQGWPFAATVAMFSDPPANSPAYNALVAGLYARAYARLPISRRTERMRLTAQQLTRGVIARTAPDGDIAFDGRSQEQAWALSSSAYAAWSESQFTVGRQRSLYLAFARRVIDRLENIHVSSGSSFGFVLTPAAGCCDRQDRPPGQDNYFDVAKYSGLAAVTMGWSLLDRPDDWQRNGTSLPTDGASDFVFERGRGAFHQHSTADLYWLLRLRSDYYDARSDSGLAVLKARGADGKWFDAVPPRPYTGGHHKPADPAAPCLVYRRGCAYLELHNARRGGTGTYSFQAIWRTARGTLVRRGSATVTPTPRGVTLSWTARSREVFRIGSFLPTPACVAGGVSAPGLTISIPGQTDCRIDPEFYAGGSRVDMLRVRSTIAPQRSRAAVTWTAAG